MLSRVILQKEKDVFYKSYRDRVINRFEINNNQEGRNSHFQTSDGPVQENKIDIFEVHGTIFLIFSRGKNLYVQREGKEAEKVFEENEKIYDLVLPIVFVKGSNVQIFFFNKMGKLLFIQLKISKTFQVKKTDFKAIYLQRSGILTDLVIIREEEKAFIFYLDKGGLKQAILSIEGKNLAIESQKVLIKNTQNYFNLAAINFNDKIHLFWVTKDDFDQGQIWTCSRGINQDQMNLNISPIQDCFTKKSQNHRNRSFSLIVRKNELNLFFWNLEGSISQTYLKKNRNVWAPVRTITKKFYGRELTTYERGRWIYVLFLDYNNFPSRIRFLRGKDSENKLYLCEQLAEMKKTSEKIQFQTQAEGRILTLQKFVEAAFELPYFGINSADKTAFQTTFGIEMDYLKQKIDYIKDHFLGEKYCEFLKKGQVLKLPNQLQNELKSLRLQVQRNERKVTTIFAQVQNLNEFLKTLIFDKTDHLKTQNLKKSSIYTVKDTEPLIQMIEVSCTSNGELVMNIQKVQYYVIAYQENNLVKTIYPISKTEYRNIINKQKKIFMASNRA